MVASGVMAVAILFAIFSPKTYVSTATFLIEGQASDEIVKGAAASYIEEKLQAITQQILSQDKLIEIIKELNLYPEMKNDADIESAIANMRKNISIRTIRAEDLDKRATRGRYSTVAFTLSFRGGEPQTVQRVASRLAALYIEKEIQTKGKMVAQTTAVLQQRLIQSKEQTATLGGRLSDFKRRHAGEFPESTPFNLEQIYRLNTQLEEINARIRILEDRPTASDGQISSLGPQNPSTTNQSANDPWARLGQLRMQLANLQSRYSEKHPDVIKTKREISSLENRLGITGGEPGNSVNQGESELKRHIRQRDEIQRKINEFQRKNQMSPFIQAEYQRLTLEHEGALKQYNDTMAKLAEAKMAKGIDDTQLGERFTIIDEPLVPQKPEQPKHGKILLVGFFMSLFGGLFASIIAENFDHSIKSPEQLQKMTKLPVLTVYPLVKTEEEELAEANKIHVMDIINGLKNWASRATEYIRTKSKTYRSKS